MITNVRSRLRLQGERPKHRATSSAPAIRASFVAIFELIYRRATPRLPA
jgi:hypothetical protein